MWGFSIESGMLWVDLAGKGGSRDMRKGMAIEILQTVSQGKAQHWKPLGVVSESYNNLDFRTSKSMVASALQ